MATMTYLDLSNMLYSDLETLPYSFESSGSGDDPGTDPGTDPGSDPTPVTITQDDIDAIAAAVINGIKSYGDSHWSTATGFATPTDVSTAEANIKSYGDTKWKTATGFATSTNVTTAETNIKNYGDTKWTTATGFATTAKAGDLETLLKKIFALLADWSVSGTSLTMTVDNQTYSFDITSSGGIISAVHPHPAQE